MQQQLFPAVPAGLARFSCLLPAGKKAAGAGTAFLPGAAQVHTKGTWGMGHQGLGTQHIPTDRTQHPHVEEFPMYSRVILKPGVQCALVFV